MTRHHLNIIGFIINCTWISIFFSGTPMMWILMGIASLLFLIFLSLGILLPNRNYFLTNTTRLNSDSVLLTFDDGPHEQLTPQVLETLRRHNIGALFFVIGKQAEEHPEIIQQILEAGHLIGNHTQTHPLMFAALRQDSVEKEIGLCDNTLIAQGIHPGTYFRPPIGYTNPRIARAVKKFKKRVIGWSLRSFDSVLKEEPKLLERVSSRIKPGDIVLFHDNLPQTEAILERFITQAKKNGIKFAQPKDLKTIFR
ncbi:polysaccharide deacetylase family protein [Crocinitomicaceae bacterium CZZ-1]|uniref:Polysaccharide deacetylase family protein n=1 Tax=Taishania pollutisoli TaxID=2766479 RepID=A0A8J6TY45_9FLAO|nr:polysaccharide deacetylase family protein [Taishania pollutisoli]MBC9813436.1 polysaccharide deacetylase family protein [Taishania pollutisoli]MBX2950677.1 polysaccharide deacetylase family protein [Crocinitomicaceae bacterium]NGF76524.1 polysaccharide deacetylase family protein [Fluviicola sp. SGL-29]